jgi:hypothetical protein
MTQIEQLISDVSVLRQCCYKGKIESIVEPYLIANQDIIKSFLNIAYQDHTHEERAAFQRGDTMLDISAVSSVEPALTALEKLEGKEGWSDDVEADDLNVLKRGLRFASKFATTVPGQLKLSPVQEPE